MLSALWWSLHLISDLSLPDLLWTTSVLGRTRLLVTGHEKQQRKMSKSWRMPFCMAVCLIIFDKWSVQALKNWCLDENHVGCKNIRGFPHNTGQCNVNFLQPACANSIFGETENNIQRNRKLFTTKWASASTKFHETSKKSTKVRNHLLLICHMHQPERINLVGWRLI